MPRPARGAQVAAAEFDDRVVRGERMGKFRPGGVGQCVTSISGRVDLNCSTSRMEHRADDTRNLRPVHPVERRSERHNPKSTQPTG